MFGPINENITGAASAVPILLTSTYDVRKATFPPSMPVMTAAAIAVGARTHMKAPCAVTVSNRLTIR